MGVLRISGQTNMYFLTRGIVSRIHRYRYAEVQAIGRSAVQHVNKAIARVTAFLEEEDITIVTSIRNIKSGRDGNEKEAIRFIIRVVEEPVSQPGPAGTTLGRVLSEDSCRAR